ncbi:hypothetical protein JKF63_00732 [Porcisia hertigi]|uniref:PSP1 C-terminal domain-containing protein n=1 Tax=Porcisia hertigi TaxID=2761500 RepID=A0A836KXC1_9TRYP|nr:hypothetical protein JKF63_00732 [Porcisia hertigi]
MPQPASSQAFDREQLTSMVHKLAMDAEDFFTQQQKTLQTAYADLSSRIEQLRVRVQQQHQLSTMNTANSGYSNTNPSLYSTHSHLPNADLLDPTRLKTGMISSLAATPSAVNAINATPLRSNIGGASRSLMSSLNGSHAMVSMADAMSENARSNGALGGYLSAALNGVSAAGVGPAAMCTHQADPVTPPSKQAAAAQPTGNGAGVMSLHVGGGLTTVSSADDSINGEFFSSAPNRGNQSHDESLMASPQASQKLSLADFIEGFNISSHSANTTACSAFNFESLYEHLTDGSGPEELVQTPVDHTANAPNLFAASPIPTAQVAVHGHHHDNGSEHPTDANTRSSGATAKSSIPIDTLRALHDQHLTTSVHVVYECGRPRVLKVADGASDAPGKLGIDPRSRCEVLVEFKRKRVLKYEAQEYVAPGSYVIVGGDRGEDLGLVVYVWCEVAQEGNNHGHGGNGAGAPEKSGSHARKRKVVGVGLTDSKLPRNMGVGNGTVLRMATETEVHQLLGTQAELERRAFDVCSQLVLDHSLPMVIVDAEYQFDKKKLTFFYEAQQRMDFRELVRHLYKTFRARIWMELLDS